MSACSQKCGQEHIYDFACSHFWLRNISTFYLFARNISSNACVREHVYLVFIAVKPEYVNRSPS